MSTGSCFMKSAISYNYVIEQLYVIIRRSSILLVDDEYFFKLKLKNSDSFSIWNFRHKNGSKCKKYANNILNLFSFLFS